MIPYDPFENSNFETNFLAELSGQPIRPLRYLTSFDGAGIYAIYYRGNFTPYNPISNSEWPIYVGKAISPGSRKAIESLGTSKVLFQRLSEHANSIHATALDINHFFCRYLTVIDHGISTGERLLIKRFSPVWNCLIDGFGNHDPGKGRYMGTVPKWDTLHPGRPWAAKCQARSETPEMMIVQLENYFQKIIQK
jgi:hypothetical protein